MTDSHRRPPTSDDEPPLTLAGLLADRWAFRTAMADALQFAWNDFTADTGCYPDMFEISTKRGRPPILSADFTQGGNFTLLAADALANTLLEHAAMPTTTPPDHHERGDRTAATSVDLSQLKGLGCSDGGCVIDPPTGMHTNGGCRCLNDLRSNPVLRGRIRTLLYNLHHPAGDRAPAPVPRQ